MTRTAGVPAPTKEIRVSDFGQAARLASIDADRSRGSVSADEARSSAALIDRWRKAVADCGGPYVFLYVDPWCEDTGIVVDDCQLSGQLGIRVCDVPGCEAAAELQRAIAGAAARAPVS